MAIAATSNDSFYLYQLCKLPLVNQLVKYVLGLDYSCVNHAGVSSDDLVEGVFVVIPDAARAADCINSVDYVYLAKWLNMCRGVFVVVEAVAVEVAAGVAARVAEKVVVVVVVWLEVVIKCRS